MWTGIKNLRRARINRGPTAIRKLARSDELGVRRRRKAVSDASGVRGSQRPPIGNYVNVIVPLYRRIQVFQIGEGSRRFSACTHFIEGNSALASHTDRDFGKQLVMARSARLLLVPGDLRMLNELDGLC